MTAEPKRTNTFRNNSGRRIIPLAVFQDFRSPASSKNKKPRSNICEQGETEIYFSISSLPTRLSSSLDWVSVRSCRNNYTNRLIFRNGRLSLSRSDYGSAASLVDRRPKHYFRK